jgi:hypothetical protein
MNCKETIELFNSKAKIGSQVIYSAHKDAKPILTETRCKAFDFGKEPYVMLTHRGGLFSVYDVVIPGQPFGTKFERDNPPPPGEKED